MRQRGEGIQIDCAEEDIPFWRGFFDLERDYSAALAPYVSDESLCACYAAFRGLRLLRQPVWETLCSFIISANNNQRRIERITRTISSLYGRECAVHGVSAYAFPSPERLAALSEEELRAAGAGYRARYLIGSARMIAEGYSLPLDELNYADALMRLTALPGVGEKVADCVLLFSSRHQCAFPVDVWMEKVMKNLYGFTGSKKQIKETACKHFGDSAGYVQQLLFHGARKGILQL